MPFRFQITEVGRARKPIIWVGGQILEGEIAERDRLAIPLQDGAEFVGTVMGILYRFPDSVAPQMASHANINDGFEYIAIGVWRDSHEINDILLRIAIAHDS